MDLVPFVEELSDEQARQLLEITALLNSQHNDYMDLFESINTPLAQQLVTFLFLFLERSTRKVLCRHKIIPAELVQESKYPKMTDFQCFYFVQIRRIHTSVCFANITSFARGKEC